MVHFFLQDILTEIFAEGFRDKIFDTEMVSALGRALSDESDDLKNSAVEFFTAAVAQGMLCFFYEILIQKYSQSVFGTRYLILR